MTTPKTDLADQLKKLREEREAKIAAFDAAQAAEIAALKAASEAEAAAAAKAAEDAARAADEADAKAAKAEADAKAAKEKHTKLFPVPAPAPRRPLEVVADILRRILSGWLFAVLILLLAILVWVFFPRPTSNVQAVQVEVPTPAVITVVVEATQPVAPTAVAAEAVPTATAAANVVQPTAAKPAAEAPKPTAAKAPAQVNPAPAPVTWNSGEFGQYQPKAGTICHGDKIGPFGNADGSGPVVVKFWSDQPSKLDMVWASCELGTGRSPEEVKKEVDKKYSKNFEIVNN